ncbi:MAG TPA: hypothetical protein VM936_15385 [Pyrinomonadaceae bacterium]|nr:hypothetical protein [Pyrinomonadaceae bacterium]
MDELWFNSEPVPGAAFQLNDDVRITSGTFKGERGAVVSPLALEPETLNLVELSSGADAEVAQSGLRRAD